MRGHPHHLLPGGQKIALQPGGQGAAVLDPPHHVSTQPGPRPSQGLGVGLAFGSDRLLCQLAAQQVHRDQSVTATMGVDPDHSVHFLSSDSRPGAETQGSAGLHRANPSG